MPTRDRCLSVAPVHQTACADNAGFPDLIRKLTAWLHWPILFALLFLAHRSWSPSSRCDLLSCLSWAQYASFGLLIRAQAHVKQAFQSVVCILNDCWSGCCWKQTTWARFHCHSITYLTPEQQKTEGCVIDMWEVYFVYTVHLYSRCLF